LAPGCIFLTEQLGPLQKDCRWVISSADEFLDRRRRQRIPAGYNLRTMDVINLYPSIDRRHLLQVLGRKIWARWAADPAKADFLVKMLELVLSSLYVTFNGVILQCDDGVPTGMSTGVILANVYLDDFDEYVNSS
jgi:hypothetical protein